MIHLRNVRLRRGPEPLLEAATVSILRGEKVGLVGRNGCGKSSLLALLRGELALDGGEWEVTNNIWLVGDDRENDLAGAQNAGWHARLLDRNGSDFEPIRQPPLAPSPGTPGEGWGEGLNEYISP